jgi:hypothetical protein
MQLSENKCAGFSQNRVGGGARIPFIHFPFLEFSVGEGCPP